ncbi:MAG: B12-binding domain-containing radical SAM protein, partial [Beijerinckiaceae bacterium]
MSFTSEIAKPDLDLRGFRVSRIILANIAHPAIGSRIPDDHLPPLGLLAIGGPLIDAGHDVELIDGDRLNLTPAQLSAEIVRRQPSIVMFGHSGSTSAHPAISAVARQVKNALQHVLVVYGGVFPTYHWREILNEEPWCDLIVRGEGEQTVVSLTACLGDPDRLAEVPGIAFRMNG